MKRKHQSERITQPIARDGADFARQAGGVLLAAALLVAPTARGASSVELPQSTNQEAHDATADPEPAMAKEGKEEFDPSSVSSVVEMISTQPDSYKEAAFAYQEGAFVYSYEQTCAVADMELKDMRGLPYAFSGLVYDKAGIDESATEEVKTMAFIEGMRACYTTDPQVLASLVLLRASRMGGQEVTQEAITALGDTLRDNPEQWQVAYEEYMSPLFAKGSSLEIGRAEAGTHGSFYEKNGKIVKIETSQLSTDTLIARFTIMVGENGYVKLITCEESIKECTQPVLGPEDQCYMTLLLPPQEFKQPPTPPANEVPDVPFSPVLGVTPEPVVLQQPPRYLDKNGRPPKTIGGSRPGHDAVARHHKQPTYLNNGAGKGVNRQGRHR